MRGPVEPYLNGLRTESRSASRFTGRHVHFVGIGGCGMSGLARMLLDDGAIVTGSEPKPNPQTFELVALGARISRDQIGEMLSEQVDLVVRTAAVPDSNAEMLAARAMGLKHIKYAELLGLVMQERFGVAVAGTHGKSTTTAMISHALLQCGADPSFVVGGTVPQLGGGSRSGASDLFVAEACEYDRSFHNLHPRVALITNIEEDHLDCYRDIDEINESFANFARLVPAKDGLILACAQDRNIARALKGIATRIELVGIEEQPELERDIAWSVRPAGLENGCPTGEVSHPGKPTAMLRLSLPGRHNLQNAAMALAACAACGVDPEKAAGAINTFTGVDRRMSRIGTFNGALVIDDYGHHPTEIRVTLEALRERYAPRRLICVFQPHQHSRTRFLLDDFAVSFSSADETIVPDIYFVRDSESDRQGISSADLVERVKGNGQNARHIPQFERIVSHLRAEAREGDLIVTMGAGNVWEIGRDLIG